MDSLRFEPLHVAAVGNAHPEKSMFLEAMCRSFALGNGLALGGSHLSDSYVRVETTPIIVTESSHWLHTPADNGYGMLRPDILETSRGARDPSPELTTPDQQPEAGSISRGGDRSPDAAGNEVAEHKGPVDEGNGKHVRIDQTVVDDRPSVTVRQCSLSPNDAATEALLSRYSPSDFPQLYMWDVPTAHQPEISFDAYILMTSGQDLDKPELALATAFRNRKDAVFLYANLDSKIRSDCFEPDIVSEIETFREVRSHCRHALYEHALGSMPLFIVSTTEPHKFDFPDLRRQLMRWTKRKQFLRKDAMARATFAALDDKKRRLQRYCSLTATACALCTAIPQTPLMALVGDSAIYLVSLAFHRCAFGLGDMDTRDVSETVSTDERSSTLRMVMEHAPCFTVWAVRRAILAAAARRVFAAPNGAAKSVLCIVSGAIVFTFVEGILRRSLCNCEHKAKILVDYVINRLLPMHIRDHSLPSTRTSTRPSSPTLSF